MTYINQIINQIIEIEIVQTCFMSHDSFARDGIESGGNKNREKFDYLAVNKAMYKFDFVEYLQINNIGIVK